MYSPEKQQIEICLLKCNLEEIENNLIEQRSAIPDLDAENEKKYTDTMSALRTARSLNEEMERLKQETAFISCLTKSFRTKLLLLAVEEFSQLKPILTTALGHAYYKHALSSRLNQYVIFQLNRISEMRLTARRTQVSRQCDDVRGALNAARSRRASLERETRSEVYECELLICRYEDALRDIADRFRISRAFYNEDEIKSEIEIIKSTNVKLQNEEEERQNEVTVLKNNLEGLEADVPEDVLAIIGKTDLENQLKGFSVQCEALRSKRDDLLKSPLTTTFIIRK